MKKMFSKFTGQFQYIAGAMMIPIIVLVICGLLMGFMSPLVNFILEPGSLFHTIALILSKMASMIMRNLPLWFVIGLSFGLSKNNKGYAAFVGVFMLMCVNTAIGILASVDGITALTLNVEFLMETKGMLYDEALIFTKLFTNVLGIFTYDTSIFVAIISGSASAILMNKYGEVKLPNFLSFFAGAKFVMVLTPFVATILGALIYFIWPMFNEGIQLLAKFIGETGLLGTFVYGCVDKALLPFGLHHLLTLPLRYTELGGAMMIDGIEYLGTTNISNALIGSPTATSYLIRDFTSGRLLTNLGGFPGATLAMYFTAKKENRKKVLALLIPALFTATFVGVTEPIEFTILFANPLLYYLIHVPLAGLSFFLTELTQVSVQGFALIFMIPNILQPDKLQAMSLLYLVPIYFGLYFFIFKWAILKFDIPTPGRRDAKISLSSKKDYQSSIGLDNGKSDTKGQSKSEMFTGKIIEGFGGSDNMLSVENCATRLRVKVKDSSVVQPKEFWVEELGAMGAVVSSCDFQIIFGTQVINICSDVKKALGK